MSLNRKFSRGFGRLTPIDRSSYQFESTIHDRLLSANACNLCLRFDRGRGGGHSRKRLRLQTCCSLQDLLKIGLCPQADEVDVRGDVLWLDEPSLNRIRKTHHCLILFSLQGKNTSEVVMVLRKIRRFFNERRKQRLCFFPPLSLSQGDCSTTFALQFHRGS